jgi:hypothetical protein
MSVDDVTGGKRQGPAVVSVSARNVQTKLHIELSQIFWKKPPQSVSGGGGVAAVAKNFKLESEFFDKAPVQVDQLGGNGQDRRSRSRDPVMEFVQSIQLRVAVRSPVAPGKGKKHGSGGQHLSQ